MRDRFLASHLWIASLGVLILLAAWGVTSYLGTSALSVAKTSGPVAHSATLIQNSLSKASAELRGFATVATSAQETQEAGRLVGR